MDLSRGEVPFAKDATYQGFIDLSMVNPIGGVYIPIIRIPY